MAKYKENDIVKLRTYKSLSNEFGVNNGVINKGFNKVMNNNCGRKGVVVSNIADLIIKIKFDNEPIYAYPQEAIVENCTDKDRDE